MRFRFLSAILTVIAGLSMASIAQADVKDFVEGSPQTFDHSLWNDIVQRVVKPSPDGITRVDYNDLKANASDHLNGYIKQLSDTPISSFDRPEQMAYWINFYNALTLKVVMDEYPVKSIRKIGGILSFGPWKEKRVTVEGQELSLDDIEHAILRPIFQDPRIHYAVNCASVGCPNLANVAYTAANTEALLDQGARDYVNHERGVEVDGKKLIVSSIYKWFAGDFGETDENVIAHLSEYAEPELKAKLANISKISKDRYDWALTDVK